MPISSIVTQEPFTSSAISFMFLNQMMRLLEREDKQAFKKDITYFWIFVFSNFWGWDKQACLLLNSDTNGTQAQCLSGKQAQAPAKLYCFSKLYCFCGKNFSPPWNRFGILNFNTSSPRPLHSDMKSLELSFIWASFVKKYFWREQIFVNKKVVLSLIVQKNNE